jgi:integrase
VAPVASVKTLKDPDGKTRGYKVRWWTTSGAQRSQVFPLGAKAKADAFAVSVESEKLTGTELDRRGERLTVEQYAAEWLAVQSHRRSTADRGAHALALFRAMFGAKTVAKVRQSDIRAWIKARGAVVSANTLRTDYRWVRTMFHAAVADRVIHSTPCDGVRVKVAKVRPMVVPPREGVLAIAERLPAAWALLGPLGARSGLRPAELRGLCVEQVDFLRREIHVDRQASPDRRVVMVPKTTSSDRTVPLDEDTVAMISAHLAANPAGPAVDLHDDRGDVIGSGHLIFHRPSGAPISHQAMCETWKAHATAVGLPAVRPHDMRHFYASHLIRQGASVVLVSQLLGHSAPSITMDIYAHEFGDRDERARDLVAAVWASDGACPLRVSGPEGLRGT